MAPDIGMPFPTDSSLLYAFSLLLALLFWSLAFLHRDGGLKVAGALGASATVLPIIALIAGHIFVGVGAWWGIGTLYNGLEDVTQAAPQIITIIEIVFFLWSLLAAAALWTGQIEAPIQE